MSGCGHVIGTNFQAMSKRLKGILFLVDLFYVFFSVLFLIFFIIFPHWFLRDSVGRILPTPALYKMEKLLSGSKISANMLGSDVGKMRRSDPGLGFCRARNLVQQEKVDKNKSRWDFHFVENAGSDLTPV